MTSKPTFPGSNKRRQADVKTADKEARLAKALRENLRRRKAQLKGQRDAAAEAADLPVKRPGDAD